ncbi:hypothetical protein M9Y10_010063 [Tritrichomonas musculus]|uniref:Uncharacterized protein n=1 Tax=Tritrichomonas musculus TaxID=1915356 RepID=A0ABR2IQ98_9EUKA
MINYSNQKKIFSRKYSTLLTFVRHAQSAGNAKRPITFNYSQYPITELGECQAEKFVLSYSSNKCSDIFTNQIKSQFKQIQYDSSLLTNNCKIDIKADPDIIISSPFRRTVETSKYLHKRYPSSKFYIDNRLKAFTYLDEAYYTSLRYCRDKEIQKYWGKLDPLLVSGSGAESFKNFYLRTLSFFHDIIENGDKWRHEHLNNNNNSIRVRNVVCFTHAMSCRMLELLKLGMLPCFPNKDAPKINSDDLLNALKERENDVSVDEAKKAMKIYFDFKKKRYVENCESVSCLL